MLAYDGNGAASAADKGAAGESPSTGLKGATSDAARTTHSSGHVRNLARRCEPLCQLQELPEFYYIGEKKAARAVSAEPSSKGDLPCTWSIATADKLETTADNLESDRSDETASRASSDDSYWGCTPSLPDPVEAAAMQIQSWYRRSGGWAQQKAPSKEAGQLHPKWCATGVANQACSTNASTQSAGCIETGQGKQSARVGATHSTKSEEMVQRRASGCSKELDRKRCVARAMQTARREIARQRERLARRRSGALSQRELAIIAAAAQQKAWGARHDWGIQWPQRISSKTRHPCSLYELLAHKTRGRATAGSATDTLVCDLPCWDNHGNTVTK